MNIIKILKSVSFFYEINAFLKRFLLHHQRKKLFKYYEKKALKKNLVYSEGDAYNFFKNKILKDQYNFQNKKIGQLHIYWVGATKSQDYSGFIQALERFGKLNIFFNSNGEYGPILNSKNDFCNIKVNDDKLFNDIKNIHIIQKIDFLIGQMWANCFSENGLNKIKKLGIPIINISMDDKLPGNWEFIKKNSGSSGLGSGLDFVLTTSPESRLWYLCEDIRAVYWPLASDNIKFSSSNTIKDIDILFIGNNYGIRKKIIKYLEDRGINVTCFGEGWKNGYISSNEIFEYSKRAKIILGIGTIGHSKSIYTLKLRDFDSLMSGALYITHRNPDLLELFQEGIHLECYVDEKELYQKLVYYLNNLDKANDIGKKGQAYAIKNYDWYEHLKKTFIRLGFLESNLS